MAAGYPVWSQCAVQPKMQFRTLQYALKFVSTWPACEALLSRQHEQRFAHVAVRLDMLKGSDLSIATDLIDLPASGK